MMITSLQNHSLVVQEAYRAQLHVTAKQRFARRTRLAQSVQRKRRSLLSLLF